VLPVILFYFFFFTGQSRQENVNPENSGNLTLGCPVSPGKDVEDRFSAPGASALALSHHRGMVRDSQRYGT
jgi:hypothetical protein